jgi:glutamyl-tRNA reductase
VTGSALPLWVLAAHAQHSGSEERAAFAGVARSAAGGREPAGLLVTCHRVELMGARDGELASTVERAAASEGIAGVREYAGRPAAEHLFRLAAGLESAVTGEDEILHQVRELLDAVRAAAPADPVLTRALELAISVGRRARADRPRPEERSLADRAFDWVASRGTRIAGARVLVAGAGVMGRALAVGASRRGAGVTVASRDPAHARALALAVDGAWTSLADAARHGLSNFDVVLVALGGAWTGLDEASWTHTDPAAIAAPAGVATDAPGMPAADSLPATLGAAAPAAPVLPTAAAPRAGVLPAGVPPAAAVPATPGVSSPAVVSADPVNARPLPVTVDLSSPSALPLPARAALGGRYTDVDRLFAARPTVGAEAARIRAEYVSHAEALVADACDRFERWVAARPSVETLRALRAAAEERRARDLERLLRRLPGLEPRERELVEAFSEQLVAGILHGPSARLHDDADGAAARAARMLFDL